MSDKYKEALAHFSQVAAAEKQCWDALYWMGEVSNCDVCSRPMAEEPFMIDGPASSLSDPPWGNLCVVCAFKYAPSIGWGRAQLYKKTSDGRWKLVSGGSAEESVEGLR
jgi:hypothetical protein